MFNIPYTSIHSKTTQVTIVTMAALVTTAPKAATSSRKGLGCGGCGRENGEHGNPPKEIEPCFQDVIDSR